MDTFCSWNNLQVSYNIRLVWTNDRKWFTSEDDDVICGNYHHCSSPCDNYNYSSNMWPYGGISVISAHGGGVGKKLEMVRSHMTHMSGLKIYIWYLIKIITQKYGFCLIPRVRVKEVVVTIPTTNGNKYQKIYTCCFSVKLLNKSGLRFISFTSTQ